jgi:Putative beta-barrel porin 2
MDSKRNSPCGEADQAALRLKNRRASGEHILYWLRLALCSGVIAMGHFTLLEMPCAQSPEDAGVTRPLHEIGVLPSWQNQVGLERMPESEKLLLGIPTRREGLSPHLSVTEQYTDNVFFTAQNRGTDYITKIAPGMSYVKTGRRGQLFVHYTLESRAYVNNSNKNAAVSRQHGELVGVFDLTSQTTLTILERFESFQDPTEQLMPGVVGTFGRSSINVGIVEAKHRLAPSVDLLASYGNFISDVNAPGSLKSVTHQAEFGVRVRETQWGRTTAKYRARHFDFEQGPDFQSHSSLIGHEADLTETLVVSGMIGGARVAPDPSAIFLLAQASIKKSMGDALYEVSYMRDIFPPTGGLSQPLLGDFIRGSAKIRIANGLLCDAGLSWVRISSVASDALTVYMLRWNAGISYSPVSWLVARLSYDMFDQREDVVVTSINRLANQASLRLTATF